jgi:F0F1-type ATP synthase membrane subunit b/b'
MESNNKKYNQSFLNLVFLLSASAWQSLGKIPNPVTNKIEKDLDNAKTVIDTLEMLKEKTRGNLTPEEEKFISNTLADLQLNYVDELNRSTVEQSEKKNGNKETK